MTATRADYQQGVFKPVSDVQRQNAEGVDLDAPRVTSEPARTDPNAVRRWRAMLDAFHAEVLASTGRPFPDSTPDIAADRAYGRGL